MVSGGASLVSLLWAQAKILEPLSTPAPSALGPHHRAPAPRQWILLMCLFLLSLPAVTPRFYSSDEIQYFAYLRSIWFDKYLSFENENQNFYDPGYPRTMGFNHTFP